MRAAWRAVVCLAGTLGAFGVLWPQASRTVRVGPVAGGRGALLPTGWLVRPAGAQVALDGYPMASVATPDGRFLAVLSSGAGEASLAVLDAKTGRKVSAAPLADAWLGLTITPNGRLLYVSGGARGEVYEFALDDAGRLEPKRTFPTFGNQPSVRDFTGDVQLDPEGRLLYAAGLFSDSVLVINPSSGRVIERFKTGRRPYRILFHPDGKSFFVSSWADAAVYQHETASGGQLNFLRVGPHPTGMVWRDRLAADEAEGAAGAEAGGPAAAATGDSAFPWKARLFVALANTNSVAVAGVSESKELRRIGTVNVAIYPRHPAGMTPGGLALSADKRKLFVVCSDANAVAVVAVNSGAPQVEGFVPAGWYPLAARGMADGRLLVFNARGVGLDASGGRAALGGQAGSLSLVEPFDAGRLMQYSRTVIENTAFREEKLDAAHDELPGHPVPRVRGEMTPIEHVIYVLKEGQTYDHVLGDMASGAGEARYAVYGEMVTPNQHKLAREFALLDNFYASGEGEADGWHWATASIAPDFVQKLWPGMRAGRRKGLDLDGDPASLPPSGRIWHQAMAAGLAVRNYGLGVTNQAAASEGAHVARLRDLELSHVTNLKFRGPDPDYRDTDRMKAFLGDVAQWESAGPMPRLMVVRLGNGRTAGTGAGRASPRSMVADNDYALGLLVEAVSRSKYWPKTAIFVAESDGASGVDHVDAHRVPAFVISPYTRRGAVDSTLYTTGSMLRTMELILGLNPMTHYDAGATPMVRVFTPVADTKPFDAEKPRVPLDARNPGGSR